MIHAFTSVASNYIPKARVLARSLKRFHPDWRFHLVLSDAIPPSFCLDQEPFDAVITIDDLCLRNPEQWLFMHSLVEAGTGVKGFAIAKLLDQPDCNGVFYFDPDIVVLSRLDDLQSALDSASILLTPHLTEPETETEAILDNELSVLRHGIYNLGFLGVKASAEGRRFAAWWRDRLYDYCYDDIPRGIFTDQRWADLAPAYFSECRILRDPIYNVCTWNLTHRRVEGRLRDGLTVNGRPVAFYHFSGFDSGAQQAMLDKYGASMPGLYELRRWYIAECDRMGQQELSNTPWAYATYDNGTPVTRAERRLYRDRTDVQDAFPHPFRTGNLNKSYYQWFREDQRLSQRSPVSPSRANPEYRIYLSVTAADCPAARATALAMLENAFRRETLHLLGSEDLLQSLAQDDAIRKGFVLDPLPVNQNHADAFQALLGCCEWNFIFVKPGTELTQDWDLRLAWTAQRQLGIATVSPMCNRYLLTSLNLGRDLATPGLSGPPTPDALDALCYHSSAFELHELPAFLEDCVYVAADAVRAARALPPELQVLGESGFRSFLKLTQALRYSHVLADHVYVGVVEQETERAEVGPPLASVLRRIVDHRTKASAPPPLVGRATLPRQLHITHSWGGGLEHWVRNYCDADEGHQNFVLKSIGTWGSFGMDLGLYRHVDDTAPVRIWRVDPSIKGTADTHAGYVAALSEIVAHFGIERIIISSLIGHSLDALRFPLPKLMVCHDFYPFCPALNITFGEVCRECSEARLVACTKDNPNNRYFRNVPPATWLNLRPAFAKAVKELQIPLVAPSPSVRDHYARLLPAIAGNFQVIPHGVVPLGCATFEFEPTSREKPLRVVVLGSVAPGKGGAVLEAVCKEVHDFCRLYLVGCGDDGKSFEGDPAVTVIPKYRWRDLPALLAGIRPHLGLLPSVVPETFSYTLQELSEMGVPVLATRIGSFADRIDDGITGFLVEPNAAAIVESLRRLDADRSALVQVNRHLRLVKTRDLKAMLRDYSRVLPETGRSAKAYFCADSRPEPGAASSLSEANKTPEDNALQIHQLTLQLVHSRARVLALETSLSWRISAPLRLMSSIALRVRKRLNILT